MANFDGVPTQILGNVGRDDPNTGKAWREFTTGSGKPGISFSVAVQPDYDAEKPEWYDIATTNPGLIAQVKANIYGGAKDIAAEGGLVTKQGNNGKTYRTLWATRIGIISWLNSKAPAAPVNADADEGDY